MPHVTGQVVGVHHGKGHGKQNCPSHQVHHGDTHAHGDRRGDIVKAASHLVVCTFEGIPQSIMANEPNAERGDDENADHGQALRGQGVGHVPDGRVEDTKTAGGHRRRHTTGQGRQKSQGTITTNHARDQPGSTHGPGENYVEVVPVALVLDPPPPPLAEPFGMWRRVRAPGTSYVHGSHELGQQVASFGFDPEDTEGRQGDQGRPTRSVHLTHQ